MDRLLIHGSALLLLALALLAACGTSGWSQKELATGGNLREAAFRRNEVLS